MKRNIGMALMVFSIFLLLVMVAIMNFTEPKIKQVKCYDHSSNEILGEVCIHNDYGIFINFTPLFATFLLFIGAGIYIYPGND